MFRERRSIGDCVACAACPGGVSAAVAGGRLGDRRAPRRGRGCDRSGIAPVGGVIHFPLVVCTRSPNTVTSVILGCRFCMTEYSAAVMPRRSHELYVPPVRRAGVRTAECRVLHGAAAVQ